MRVLNYKRPSVSAIHNRDASSLPVRLPMLKPFVDATKSPSFSPRQSNYIRERKKRTKRITTRKGIKLTIFRFLGHLLASFFGSKCRKNLLTSGYDLVG